MTLFSDDPSVDTPTHVAVKRVKVKGGKPLSLRLLPRGGAAAIFTPVKK